ncbi:MAG TPA: AMP-binding protein [Catenuloplanes sp.]
MQQVSSPPVAPVAPDAALPDAVARYAATEPDRVAFGRPGPIGWQPVTSAEFATEVAAVAAGLVASGVGPGDRVGLLSRTRYEWTVVDYAIWTAGAVCVPIYETSSAEQVRWILGDSGAVAVVVETAEHAATVAGVLGALPGLRHCWQLDGGGLDALATAGRAVSAGQLADRRAGLGADSLATIIYTSGTTGRPKGCELTHGNLLYVAAVAPTVIPPVGAAGSTTLLFLPLAHVFARIIQVTCVQHGVRLGHTADIAELVDGLRTFRPTFLLAVPRVFEKVYNAARHKADVAGRGALFDRATQTAVDWSTALDTGGARLSLRLRHALFDRLVYGRLRSALGGRVTVALSGGAPLGVRLGHFFRGIGVTINEGYGLTETSGPSTCGTPGQLRIGTVGRPVPGSAVRISDIGEVQVSGPQVFRGYWNAPAATAEVLRDGWLATGDLGQLDDDGYLTITGRIKELIVTAGGKNVSPAVLEDRLRSHPLISQCMVVGDRRPYIGALITLDQDALRPWLTARGRPADPPVADLVDDPELLGELQGAVDAANRAVSRAESIRRFVVLPVDWTVEHGQLTPSLKLRRSVVLGQCATDVDALYGEPDGD